MLLLCCIFKVKTPVNHSWNKPAIIQPSPAQQLPWCKSIEQYGGVVDVASCLEAKSSFLSAASPQMKGAEYSFVLGFENTEFS